MLLPSVKPELKLLAFVILSSRGPKKCFMKVSGISSLLGINVGSNPIMEAAGGRKASIELAGSGSSVFRRFHGWFRKFLHSDRKQFFFTF